MLKYKKLNQSLLYDFGAIVRVYMSERLQLKL